MSEPFSDRSAAGRELAEQLARDGSCDGVIVLGLARGGVPVAYEVARRLQAPLDVLVVRKLGVPGHEELAIGAIASGGPRVLNAAIVRLAGVDEPTLDSITARERDELQRRERAYRGDRDAVGVRGRTVVVADDGLATGASMRAAVAALRDRGAETIVVAAPVAASATCASLRAVADEVVCVLTPDPFVAVGSWYRDFAPVSDEQVRRMLEQAGDGTSPARGS